MCVNNIVLQCTILSKLKSIHELANPQTQPRLLNEEHNNTSIAQERETIHFGACLRQQGLLSLVMFYIDKYFFQNIWILFLVTGSMKHTPNCY